MIEELDLEPIWQKYGLRDSPYTTKALNLVGTLEIEKLFYGRKLELENLGKKITSTNSSRTAVVGEVGVGKTTFANYLRWYLARRGKVFECKFITVVEEFKVQEDWNITKFLRETLFSIYISAKIFRWEEEGMKLNVLDKIKKGLDINQNKQLEIRDNSMEIKDIGSHMNKDIGPEVLQSWFSELCREIRGYGKRLILQYNNLENMSEENLSKFLMSIKEILQEEGTHWLFLGPSQIISSIENTSQIHSIFNEHIILKSLSEEEVITILEKRCEYLKLPQGNYFKPYDEDTIKKLYKKLNGNIRFIFKLLEDTAHSIKPPCKVTINEVNFIQEREKEKIMGSLTQNQQKVIALLIDKEEVSMGELSDGTGILQTNLPKEIKELKKKGLITIRKSDEDKRFSKVRLSQKTWLCFAFSGN